MNLLIKKPLTGLGNSKYLQHNQRDFISYSKVAPIEAEKRLLWVSAQLLMAKKELLEDGQSEALYWGCMKMIASLVNQQFGELYAHEYNKIVKEIRSKSDINYDHFNSSITALVLISHYLEEYGNENHRPIQHKLNKQLEYIRKHNRSKSDIGKIYRDSVLYAENIRRIYIGKEKVEENKTLTVEEIKANKIKFLNKYRLTTFSFKDKTFTHRGDYLTLKECVKKFVDGYPKAEFKTLDEYFYIKKHNIVIRYDGWDVA